MIPTRPPSTSIPSSIQYHFSHEDMIFRPNDVDDVDFELPEDLDPFLEKLLENGVTADAIALWWAPDPYSRRSGHTQQVQDIPLVKNWYLEHRPPGQPVKVCVSQRTDLGGNHHAHLPRDLALHKQAKSTEYLWNRCRISLTHSPVACTEAANANAANNGQQGDVDSEENLPAALQTPTAHLRAGNCAAQTRAEENTKERRADERKMQGKWNEDFTEPALHPPSSQPPMLHTHRTRTHRKLPAQNATAPQTSSSALIQPKRL
ncbi:hypothetical protein SCP_0113360 [Sparassis crispa]|uniref:PROCN domain-containing protein n=1 Tax=Sparassis crispa TaxID=139825 RepID=A0A401G8G6_9APHY|nr:hypothetical protein SCP_0113360 [Sparassis crispa]GBE78447.1 hypothetical protein SCP_0113360 [Sparassis crispa]